jgi:hypothetical protein
MGKLFEEFLEYISNASEEQIAKDWEELKSSNDIGPTATEYFNYIDELTNNGDPLNEIKISNVNPEFPLDFLLLN